MIHRSFGRPSSWLGVAVVLGALALAPAVVATTWVTLSPTQLKQQSEVVAVGTITSAVAIEIAVPWFSDPEGDMIYTRYEMKVERGVKGAKAGDTVVFVSMGGSLAGRGVEVPGAPHFQVGDKVVGGFFLNGIDHLQPHWGGVNRVVKTRRGEIVIGETGYTVARNETLGDVVVELENAIDLERKK